MFILVVLPALPHEGENQTSGYAHSLLSAGEDAAPFLKDLEEGDADDEQLLESLRKVSGRYDIENFDVPRLTTDVQADLHCLEKMKAAVAPITPAQDAKVQRLIKWLEDESLLRQHKLLIFTQFTDTGRYLHDNLRGKVRHLLFADSKRDDLDEVVKRFAPIANNVPAGKVKIRFAS